VPADQLAGGYGAPALAVGLCQVAHRLEVCKLIADGSGARGKHHGSFGIRDKRELAQTSHEFRRVSRLIRRQVGEHVVEQVVSYGGQLVDQARRAAFLRFRGLGDRAGLLEAAQGRVQRVVVQHDAGRLLHPLAQLVAVRGASPQAAQDEDLNVGHVVQYDLCQTGRSMVREMVGPALDYRVAFGAVRQLA
jgi:hypothetical protein